MKAAVWIWMLFWTVFTGFAITALLVAVPAAGSMHFVAAAVACALLAIPFSLSASKALSA